MDRRASWPGAGARGDTIFAPATGGGRAGVAVLRISGPQAGRALAALTGRDEWVARRAIRVRLRGSRGELLDDALALWFPAPASFTGEDVAELHVHGGRAVIAAVLEALALVPDLRPADAGEFSRRAFENGKLDLTQLEALADLVAAETAAQHRQAIRQLDGALGRLYEGWRARLVTVMAKLEASIDFADEDLPAGLEDAVRCEVSALRDEVSHHLADRGRGERLRHGLSVVLFGAPNAGKSSLFNALAGRDAAIVDAAPGTTRDVVEVALDMGGLPVVLADTAGLRLGEGAVEREGVRRARQRVEGADLRIAVLDGERWPLLDETTMGLLNDATVITVNKSDLGRVRVPVVVAGHDAVAVSALTGEGVEALMGEVGRRLADQFCDDGALSPTRQRHRQWVNSCLLALTRFDSAEDTAMAAEELRAAAAALGRIVGRLDVEEVFDALFREFCIGK